MDFFTYKVIDRDLGKTCWVTSEAHVHTTGSIIGTPRKSYRIGRPSVHI